MKFLFSSSININILRVLVARPLRSTRFILHLRSWETCWHEHGSANGASNRGLEFALVSYRWALWWLHVTASRTVHPAFRNKWVNFHFHHHRCVKFSSLHIPPQHLLSSPTPFVVCDCMCVCVVCLSDEQTTLAVILQVFSIMVFDTESLIGLRLGKQAMLAGQGAPQV